MRYIKKEDGTRKETPTYVSWKRMKSRCNNTNDPAYHNYGGRGIEVCKKWLNSFEDFVTDMKERPAGTSIDRIDNDGNYEPANCRWATVQEQIINRRNYTGLTHKEYCKQYYRKNKAILSSKNIKVTNQ